MVQIGRRGPHDAFLKMSKNSQKSQNLNFKILVYHFFASVSPVYCKKIRLNWNKTDGGDRFGSFAPMAIPAMALLQQHDARRDILIEPVAWRHAAIEARRHSNWGSSELGRNQAIKTNRLIVVVHDVVILFTYYFTV